VNGASGRCRPRERTAVPSAMNSRFCPSIRSSVNPHPDHPVGAQRGRLLAHPVERGVAAVPDRRGVGLVTGPAGRSRHRARAEEAAGEAGGPAAAAEPGPADLQSPRCRAPRRPRRRPATSSPAQPVRRQQRGADVVGGRPLDARAGHRRQPAPRPTRQPSLLSHTAPTPARHRRAAQRSAEPHRSGAGSAARGAGR